MTDVPFGVPGADASRAMLAEELRHWRGAAAALTDLDLVAAPATWAALESYLGRAVRTSLRRSAGDVLRQADRVAADLAAARNADDLARVRQGMLRLRGGYLRAETVIDFYTDAVATRAAPRMGTILRGLDALAVDGLDRGLRPLGIEVPPVLTYLDKGLGASIMRSGARLWDASLSPAAAIKITRHNLLRPTSLLHEDGHQFAHLTGWNGELGDALFTALRPVSAAAAQAWRGWASEVAADVYAFVLLGYAPVPALATVVDGPAQTVFRMVPGDPHPFGWLRVQFNVALCGEWFGPGPWDALGAVWAARHPLDGAPPEAAEVARGSLPRLANLAGVCTRTPMRAFGGRTLAELIDPRRVAPAELRQLAGRAGPSLYTSSHLQRLEPMRILSWSVLQEYLPTAGSEARPGPTAFESWLHRLGGERSLAA
ncbi:hypothetical protein [Actinomadura sp. SCN-SB]|uniref:hypothetical protein n=1 Tax=Actinomadura sp. SCN-SB TaxID=3373092 RepID=UPI0037530EB1